MTKNDTNPPLNYEDARGKGYPRVAIQLREPTNGNPIDAIIDLAVIRHDPVSHFYQGLDLNNALYRFMPDDIYTGDIVETDELYKLFKKWATTVGSVDTYGELQLTTRKNGAALLCYTADDHPVSGAMLTWKHRPQGVFLLRVAIARKKDLL